MVLKKWLLAYSMAMAFRVFLALLMLAMSWTGDSWALQTTGQVWLSNPTSNSLLLFLNPTTTPLSCKEKQIMNSLPTSKWFICDTAPTKTEWLILKITY